MSDEEWFPEPFGPIYERPLGAACPDCECCTARLCERAAQGNRTCAGEAAAGDQKIVADCPCTARRGAR